VDPEGGRGAEFGYGSGAKLTEKKKSMDSFCYEN